MSENLNNAKCCTLTCDFISNSDYKPSQDEMQNWLRCKSGLTEDYYHKITCFECNIENNVLKSTFAKTANCFIAMKQIKERVLCGRHGKCKVRISCPRGEFKSIHLEPVTVELLMKNDIIKALKEYGEIVEMFAMKWCDFVNASYIPTGETRVLMLLKKKLPEKLDIGEITCEVIAFPYEMIYPDEILQELWNNCTTSNDVDYTKKKFLLKDEKPGCRIIIKHYIDIDYEPSQRDVYEWLVRKSGLSQDHLRKIVAFKSICYGKYEVLFDAGVNCLLAMKEMKNNEIAHCHDDWTEADISCPKRQFRKVVLKPDAASSKTLTRRSVEKVLKSYGAITKIEKFKVPTTRLKSNADGKIMSLYDRHCKMFLKSEIPRSLQIDGNNVEVIVSEQEPEVYDDKMLKKIWIKINV